MHPKPRAADPAVLLTDSPAWLSLLEHFDKVGRGLDMRKLFVADNGRANKFTLNPPEIPLLLDYSKNLITEETLRLLINLARETDVEGYRQKMCAGEPVNVTEDRAALHVALRARPSDSYRIARTGEDVLPAVHAELDKMRAFSDLVRSGRWLGCEGDPIRDVVNIGIGGSDLGPLMVCEALEHFAHPKLRFHFVSNIDGTHLRETLKHLDPRSTLFVIVSKTFTTQETMQNARSARRWFLAGGQLDAPKTGSASRLAEQNIAKHFVAVSTNEAAVKEFGVDPANMFKFWDWVGGRYSLWSAVGLSICLAIGADRFGELLEGARLMDEHFKQAPLEQNMPVLMALVGIWYNNFWGAQSLAILPYEQYLHRFPAYLQQADMESNGKHATIDGRLIDGLYQTGPIVWGEPGTNGQHAFYQLIHQGTKLIPVDFIVGLDSLNDPSGDSIHHKILLANCLAQAEALMVGRAHSPALADSAGSNDSPHRSFLGNRPSNLLVYDRLSPAVLGALIALYEHKIFVQGVIWRVNSFDQWGVELGKQLAGQILQELVSDSATSTATVQHDSSTVRLIQLARQQKISK